MRKLPPRKPKNKRSALFSDLQALGGMESMYAFADPPSGAMANPHRLTRGLRGGGIHEGPQWGQKRKGSQRAYSVRITPKSRHHRCALALPICADFVL